jgi:DNA-binding transcriptional ArsR family regulator
MVVDLRSPDADRLFGALGDRTRRDILTHVLQSEESVSALARRYPVSTTAVQKQVAVLEAAGLVSKRRSGREQLVSGNPEALRRASALLDELEQVWRRRLDAIDDLLDPTPPPGDQPCP